MGISKHSYYYSAFKSQKSDKIKEQYAIKSRLATVISVSRLTTNAPGALAEKLRAYAMR